MLLGLGAVKDIADQTSRRTTANTSLASTYTRLGADLLTQPNSALIFHGFAAISEVRRRMPGPSLGRLDPAQPDACSGTNWMIVNHRQTRCARLYARELGWAGLRGRLSGADR